MYNKHTVPKSSNSRTTGKKIKINKKTTITELKATE